MSAFNAEGTLTETLESLLSATFSDWEAIIVDDASEDGTGSILNEWSQRDRRIRILTNEENIGLAASLNRAIEASDGEYMARLDADDLNLPKRFTMQVDLLNANRHVGIVGTGRYSISAERRVLRYHSPNCPTACIPWRILWGVPFAHPSVMLRRSVLEEHRLRYNPEFRLCQDFELWSRLLKFTDGANIDCPGILYRVHPQQNSTLKRDVRLDAHLAVCRRQLEDLLDSTPSDEMLEANRALFLGEAARTKNVPDAKEVLEFRMEVSRALAATGSNAHAARLGFGLDLVSLARQRGAGFVSRSTGGWSWARDVLAAIPVASSRRLRQSYFNARRKLVRSS